MGLRDEAWGRLRRVLTRGRGDPARVGDGHVRRGRRLEPPAGPQVLDVAQTATAKPGGPGRWVRAVDGELVNLDGCDYVAVEQEGTDSYVVIARMHGGARNWALARYTHRRDATQAQDWLAGHLQAWRLDLVAVAEPATGADAGQVTD
jgi:hypothetical protein